MKEITPIISQQMFHALCKTKSLRIKGFKLMNAILWHKTTELWEVQQNSAMGIHQQQSTCKV
jgi:hypothetical protein